MCVCESVFVMGGGCLLKQLCVYVSIERTAEMNKQAHPIAINNY